MSRSVVLVTVCAVLACGLGATADEDPVEKKLTAAKEEFEKSTEKARAGLLTDLKKRAEAAQKAGDLKALERVQAEAKAFEDSRETPKSVQVKGYEGQLRTAQARLEEEYKAAVKQYTKDGKIALAKVVQGELDDFKGAKNETSHWKYEVKGPKGGLLASQELTFLPTGRFTTGDPKDRQSGNHKWGITAGKLTIRWSDPKAPGGEWVESLKLGADGVTYAAELSNGKRITCWKLSKR